MDEFPSNSRSARPTPKSETPEKNLKPVTKGTTRKKPLGKRIKETFFGGTTKGVWDYVLTDVLIPAARDMVADAASQGVERMVFGEARSTSRRTGARPSSVGNYTPYTRYSSPVGRATGREEPRNVPGRRISEPFNFDEILIATRTEAEMVLERLYDIVERYSAATVADLYNLVDISGSYTDDKYGWEDLRGASVRRVHEGYLLDLPKPEPLEK